MRPPYENRKPRVITTAISLIVICLVYTSFRSIHFHNRKETEATILSILRNEIKSANSYAVAKTISDLETLHLINCAILSELPERRTFYDSTAHVSCKPTLLGSHLNPPLRFILTAINGSNYQVEAQMPVRWLELLFEMTLYGLTVVSSFAFWRFRARILESTKLRLHVAHLEKEFLLESTRQIKHDVSSPLSALKLAIGRLENIDDRHRDILRKSLSRTEMIFHELSFTSSCEQKAQIRVQKTIAEILEEKAVTWGSQAQVHFTAEIPTDLLVVGSESDFKRILSNILNNSFEARRESGDLHLRFILQLQQGFARIQICDNGIGIPKDILGRLGREKISHGKSGFSDAGNGIGIYSAVAKIKSWNGEMLFRSSEHLGTEVEIRLPVAT